MKTHQLKLPALKPTTTHLR